MVAARAAVVAEMADVRGGVVVRRAAADAVLRVGRVLQRRAGARAGRRGRRRRCPRAPRPPRRAAGRRRCRRAAPPPAGRPSPRASARPRARARRTGRAGRGRGCRGTPLAAAGAPRAPGSAPSSTSNSPRSASPAASSAEATPETRFAPAALCASRCRGRRISAAIAVVVVLPFVAETTAVPVREPRGEAVDRAAVELGEELARDRRAAAGSRGASRARRRRARRRSRARVGGGGASGERTETRLHGTTCGFLNLLYTY